MKKSKILAVALAAALAASMAVTANAESIGSIDAIKDHTVGAVGRNSELAKADVFVLFKVLFEAGLGLGLSGGRIDRNVVDLLRHGNSFQLMVVFLVQPNHNMWTFLSWDGTFIAHVSELISRP